MSPRVSMPIVVQSWVESWNDNHPKPFPSWRDVETPALSRLAEAERWVSEHGVSGVTYRIVRVSPETLTPREVTTIVGSVFAHKLRTAQAA